MDGNRAVNAEECSERTEKITSKEESMLTKDCIHCNGEPSLSFMTKQKSLET